MSPVFVLRSHPDSADLPFCFQNSPFFIIIICSNLNDIAEDKNSLAHSVHIGNKPPNLHLTGSDDADDNVSLP